MQPSPPEPSDSAFSRRIPLIVASAFFMETLDGTIVTTALPAIAQSLHRSALALTPSISVYLVALAALVPTAGWASDRFGSRRLFASAVAVFTLASLLCALAPSSGLFFAARGLQGAAAAFMSPVGRLVVLRETPKRYIIEALAIITWPALIGPVVGPPLAGFITTYTSWRWIFLINLPVGLIGVWLIVRLVPNHVRAVLPRFDTPGFLLTASALTVLIDGLTRAAEGAASAAALALIGAGLVLGAVAVYHALHRTSPMLDLRSARVLSFSISQLSSGMLGRVAISATPYLLPLMLEIGFGLTPIAAGGMLLVYMLGNLGMKSVTTPILRRFGFARVLLIDGCLCALAIGACGLIEPRGVRWAVYASYGVLLFAGMTRSMYFTTVNTLAFADIGTAERAGASTLAAMTQQVASTVGVAVAAVVLALSARARAVHGLRLEDFRHAFWVAGVVMLLASLWTLRLPRDAGAEVSGRVA
jgi:EmrB/QacA subfamily drug resistance transporter